MKRKLAVILLAMGTMLLLLPNTAGANVNSPPGCDSLGRNYAWDLNCWVGPPGQYVDTGPYVGVVQTIMARYGNPNQYVGVDCLWGSLTQSGIWTYQANHHTTADPPAIVGPNTWGNMRDQVPYTGTVAGPGTYGSFNTDYYGKSSDNIYRFRWIWYYSDFYSGSWEMWVAGTTSNPTPHYMPVVTYSAERCWL